jgi:hypothetical protein
MPKKEKIELGDEVKDLVTGFKGIAVSITRYISGCDRIGVKPPYKLKEAKQPEELWFDSNQLIVVKKEKVKLENTNTVKKMKTKKGGPRRIPQEHKRPER